MIDKGKLDVVNISNTESAFKVPGRALNVRIERSHGKIRVIKNDVILIQNSRKGLLKWLNEQKVGYEAK